jgi:hypothetical protein
MKKKTSKPNTPRDDLRAEYNLSQLKGKVRGKHLAGYRASNNLALLDPAVRAAFPSDDAVNQALRSLMEGQVRS